ncbi:carboxymuconolactone decarboxylase family protein [Kribbella sp. NPDC055071]
MSWTDPYDEGLRIRREILGDAHVDAAPNPLNEGFQDLITRYAWGSVWARDGLDRRTRSVITLTALVAGHHWSELEFHLKAALTNGLTPAEISELLLQCAIYCGVPTANTAYTIAARVLPTA